jgi:hypothetical protein
MSTFKKSPQKSNLKYSGMISGGALAGNWENEIGHHTARVRKSKNS